MKIKLLQIMDEWDVTIKCDQHATKPEMLFLCLESDAAYESVSLTREQARRLRDWLEHEFLDKT